MNKKEYLNILFITCDQLRKDALGCYGNPVVRTPNIDSLAQRGMQFEQAYVTCPSCAPSRASIVTGRYPSVHGLRINGVSLPESEKTFMEALRNKGYATYIAGKLHLHPQWNYPPGSLDELVFHTDVNRAINPQPMNYPYYGFERCDMVEDTHAGPYGDFLREKGFDPWDDPHSFSYPQHQCACSAFPAEYSKTNWITDRTLDFLKDTPQDQPFFAWASYVAPHHPFIIPEEDEDLYDPKDMPSPLFSAEEVDTWPQCYRDSYYKESGSHEAIGMYKITDEQWKKIAAYYYAMVERIDNQIGRLIQTLKDQGKWDNTIVFFLADHGELLGEHHRVFKAGYYDCLTNVPFLVSGAGIAPESKSDELYSTVDIAPTLFEMTGLEAYAGHQGVSLLPVLSGEPEQSGRDAVYIESINNTRTIRTKTSRLTWHGRNEGELYDLVNDPHNFNNLWNTADAVQMQGEMMSRLIEAMAEHVDPLPARKYIV